MKKRFTFDHLMGLLILLGGIFVLCCVTGCHAQNADNIPVMEYYDASGEVFDNNIPIYADGVIDFIYCAQDEEYIIEYMDDDYFDRDNLPQLVNCVNNDSNYVTIYCNEKDFFDYLAWYSMYDRNSDSFYAANEYFFIKEIKIDEDRDYWYYKLVRK